MDFVNGEGDVEAKRFRRLKIFFLLQELNDL